MFFRWLLEDKSLKIEDVIIGLKADFEDEESRFAYFDFCSKKIGARESYWLMLYRNLESNEVTIMTNPALDQNNTNPKEFCIKLFRDHLHLKLPYNVWKSHSDFYSDYHIGFNVSDSEFNRIKDVLECIVEAQGRLEVQSI